MVAVDGQGHPMCRHEQVTPCSRWWCAWHRALYCLFAAGVLLLLAWFAVPDGRHFYQQPMPGHEICVETPQGQRCT